MEMESEKRWQIQGAGSSRPHVNGFPTVPQLKPIDFMHHLHLYEMPITDVGPTSGWMLADTVLSCKPASLG